MKDKSNFYNLTEAEQDNGRKDLWKDSFPDVPKFANDLKKAILQPECPRVISLEGGYGMGKTYFSSRFCEYLRSNREGPISAIYFSAWEDDNLPDPFLSFSRAILTLFPRYDKIKKKWGRCLKLAADSIDITPALFDLPISEGNCIVFIGQGDGSAGYSVYKQEKSLCGGTVICGYSKNLNKYTGLFISCCSDMQASKYSHGYSRNDLRLKRDIIKLPITKEGKPDYQFMEDYIKEMMTSKREVYVRFLKEQTTNKKIDIEPLDSKQWKEFSIQDIFEILPGKRLESENQITGDRPFIGATDSNNGITNFVSNSNASLDRNVLGINYNGSVCEGFYHPYECIFSDDVKRLHLKHVKDNRNVLLLFSMLIQKQKNKYRYAYKFNTERMKKQYIMLPIDDNGNPDYAYMEAYTYNIIVQKRNEYINYVNSL